MNLTLSLNRLFILAAVLVWLVVAVIDIVTSQPVDHELGWVAVGLAIFGLSFLVP